MVTFTMNNPTPTQKLSCLFISLCRKIGRLRFGTRIDVVALRCLLTCAIVIFAPVATAQELQFRMPTSYPLSSQGVALAEADYDADGDIDVAVITADAGLAIAWNDGTGAFRVEVTDVLVPVGSQYDLADETGAHAGDFDGNGWVDILFYASRSTTSIMGCLAVVLFNSGDGSFFLGASLDAQPNLEEPSIWGCTAAEVGDYNSDGALDFVLTYRFTPVEAWSGMWSVFNTFLGNGDGTFAAPSINFLSPLESQSWAGFASVSGDLNGDGITDLVFGEEVMYVSGAFEHRVTVWAGDGSGGFSPRFDTPVVLGGGTNFLGGRVQDFSGDGVPDVVIVTRTFISGYVSRTPVLLFEGNGDGTLNDPVEIADELEAVGVHSDDFNGDGIDDLKTMSSDGVIASYRGSPDGLVAEERSHFVGSARTSTTADVNADGRADLAVLDENEHALTIVLSDAQGPVAPTLVRLPGAQDEPRLATGDFNRDGLLDIIQSGYEGVGVMFAAPNGGFVTGPTIGIGTLPILPLTAELNGDQNLDVVIPNALGGFTTVFGTQDGTFGGITVQFDRTEYMAATLGDMDGDGDLDLATFAVNLSEPAVQLFSNDGAANFVLSASIPVETLVGELRFLDTNADGALDLFIGSSRWLAQDGVNSVGPGDSWILLGDGSGAFGALMTWPVASDSFDFADVNQDDIPDVVTHLGVALGDGTGSFGVSQNVPRTRASTFADFNVDGFIDLLISPESRASENPSVGVSLGNGDGTFEPLVPLLSPSVTSAAVADFNSDGLPDVYALYTLRSEYEYDGELALIIAESVVAVPPDPDPPPSSCGKKPGSHWGQKKGHRLHRGLPGAYGPPRWGARHAWNGMKVKHRTGRHVYRSR
jgi:hypothetical protein